MKAVAVAIMVAGFAMAFGLYAGLHEIAHGVSVSGQLTLQSGLPGIPGIYIDVSR
jgi:hypothetical protein